MQTWSLSHLQKLLLNTIKNPVPIGFIYVQLPKEKSPTEIWPWMTWINVSSDYAGHFFRVEGGNAAPFGQSQIDAFQDHTHSSIDGGTVDGMGDWFEGAGNLRNDWYALISSRNADTNIYKHNHILVSNNGNGQPRNASETRRHDIANSSMSQLSFKIL
jgi:hypothetical protein